MEIIPLQEHSLEPVDALEIEIYLKISKARVLYDLHIIFVVANIQKISVKK